MDGKVRESHWDRPWKSKSEANLGGRCKGLWVVAAMVGTGVNQEVG